MHVDLISDRDIDRYPTMEPFYPNHVRHYVLEVKSRMELFYAQMAFYDQWLSKYNMHMAYHLRMMNHGPEYLLKHKEYVKAHERTSLRHAAIMRDCQRYISSLEPYMPSIDPVLWSKLTSPQVFPFLELPGEIRNAIYGLALSSKTRFTLGLFRFQPSMTSILRVNKQIYLEASSVFYHENTFRFPATLFVDAPIYKTLEDICGVSAACLQRMKKITLEVPIHGRQHAVILRAQTAANLDALWNFISYYNGSGLHLQINYQISWGEGYNTVPWHVIRALLRPFSQIEEQGRGKVEVNVETQAFWLDDCINDLVRLAPSIHASPTV